MSGAASRVHLILSRGAMLGEWRHQDGSCLSDKCLPESDAQSQGSCPVSPKYKWSVPQG